jgi:hypothetical protein
VGAKASPRPRKQSVPIVAFVAPPLNRNVIRPYRRQEIITMEIIELQNVKINSYKFDKKCEMHIIQTENGVITSTALIRILKDNKIILTNLDNNQIYGLKTPINFNIEFSKIINNKSIIKATGSDKNGDLLITLEDSIQIEFINNSSGYEPWQINLKSGKEYIAAAGGKIFTNNK